MKDLRERIESACHSGKLRSADDLYDFVLDEVARERDHLAAWFRKADERMREHAGSGTVSLNSHYDQGQLDAAKGLAKVTREGLDRDTEFQRYMSSWRARR